jgi:hypothetical protein
MLKNQVKVDSLSHLKIVRGQFKRPIKVLIVAQGLIPTIVIGVLRPLRTLEHDGDILLRLRYSNFEFWLQHDIEWCDVGVFYRNQEPSDREILYQLKRKCKSVIYGTDDNFMEIPLNTALGRYHRTAQRLHVMRRFYELADVVHVYSECIKSQVTQYQGRVSFHRSYFDLALIKEMIVPKKDSSIIRIAYATARIDDPRLEKIFYSALEIIADKYGNKIEISFWKQPPFSLKARSNIRVVPEVKGYEKFIKGFYLAGYDIGLAPSIDEPFFHSKTNNKYREYGGCKVAGVYSGVAPYLGSIDHGVTGWLVQNSTEAWVEGISLLIEDVELRKRLVDNAFNDVKLNYSFSNSVSMWAETIVLSLNERKPPPLWLHEKNINRNIAIVTEDILEPRYVEICNSLNIDLHANILENIFTPPNIDRFAAIVFLIKSQYELNIALTYISNSRSVIFDLIQFPDNINSAIESIYHAAEHVPISVIITQSNVLDNTYFPSRDNFTLLRIAERLPGFNENYSIQGQNGQLMDVVEKHLKYGEVVDTRFVWLFARLDSLRNRWPSLDSLRNRWLLFLDRLNRIWIVVIWRFGRRKV